MKTYTYDEVIAILTEIVEERGRDYVYNEAEYRGEGATPRCVNYKSGNGGKRVP